MKIPCRHVVDLWHIGTLDLSDKAKKSYSLEGNLFSMSQCPYSWLGIARLGGGSLYHSGKGFLLVDMHRLMDAATPELQALKDTIIAYGKDQGLCQQTIKTYHVYWDDELEAEVAERIDSDDIDPDEGMEIVEKDFLEPSDSLVALHRITHRQDAFEFVAIEWLRKHTCADGVVWMETLDPLRYSAPRVGIFDIDTSSLQKTEEWPDCSEQIEWMGPVVELLITHK